MIEEYKNYAKFMNCDNDVIEWIETHLKPVVDDVTQTEIEHIIDYLASDKRPKRLTRMSYEHAKNNTDKWNKALIKKGEHIKETADDVEVVKDFGDGFKIVKLVGENAFKREGFLMRHCVASYYGGNAKIYSLRDADNMPHCTMEKNQQIKGKGNGSINPKYVGYIVSFLEEIGMEVGDNEMHNLGYINVEKLKRKIDTSKLFNEKYWYEGDVLFDRNGDEYCELDLWGYKPLIKVSGDFDIKINFDLPKFIKSALSKLKPTIGSYGYSAQIGSSGNPEQIVSSGYSAQIGSSGNSARIGSYGYYVQIGSSGDSTQIGSSGDYAQIGSSGNSERIGSYGYYAQIGSSGDSARIGSSGNSAQIVSSGDSARIGSSGDSARISVAGGKSIASCSGYNGQIKAKNGTPIAIAEYDSNYDPVRFVCGVIGQDGLKENTWYKAENGKLVEVEND